MSTKILKETLMKLSISIGILFFVSGSILAQEGLTDRELIWLNPAQLSANDFMKESPGRNTKFSTGKRSYKQLEGFIYCGIKFNYEVVGNTVSYSVVAFMDPNQSWIRQKDNHETLLHEQAHFNITEIFARTIRKKLKRIKNIEKARKIYQQSFDDLKKKQEKFDKDHEGESGLNHKWKEWISNELDKLKPYCGLNVNPH